MMEQTYPCRCRPDCGCCPDWSGCRPAPQPRAVSQPWDAALRPLACTWGPVYVKELMIMQATVDAIPVHCFPADPYEPGSCRPLRPWPCPGCCPCRCPCCPYWNCRPEPPAPQPR